MKNVRAIVSSVSSSWVRPTPLRKCFSSVPTRSVFRKGMLTYRDTKQIRFQCLDRAHHVRHHVRTTVPGRQFCDSGFDCERSSDFDLGFIASAPGREESELCGLADSSSWLRATCIKASDLPVALTIEVAKLSSKSEIVTTSMAMSFRIILKIEITCNLRQRK